MPVILVSLVVGLASRDQMTAGLYSVPVLLLTMAPIFGSFSEGIRAVVRFANSQILAMPTALPTQAKMKPVCVAHVSRRRPPVAPVSLPTSMARASSAKGFVAFVLTIATELVCFAVSGAPWSLAGWYLLLGSVGAVPVILVSGGSRPGLRHRAANRPGPYPR